MRRRTIRSWRLWAFDAMDKAGGKDDTLVTWSLRGTTLDGFAKPEIVAPGRHIASPLPSGTSRLDRSLASAIAGGYASINGTSFLAAARLPVLP
jgi:hypothetical protein